MSEIKREQILSKAEKLINGRRARDYGDAYDNHARIAEGWNVIVREAMAISGELTPAHVALMMDWLKTCRLLTTINHEDSWIDKAGYTALGGEFALMPRDNSAQKDETDV
jgi:hypothetical protein